MKQVVEIVRSDFGSRACELGGAFARWWINELLSSTPTSIRRRLGPQRDEFLVRIQDNAIEAGRRTGPSTLDWRALDGTEAPDVKLAAGAAALLLPAQIVLRRSLDLPLAAASSLHETTSFQIGRITPFKANEVCHVARLLRQDRAKKSIRAEIAVVPRAVLERLLAKLEAHEIQPAAILVDGDDLRPRLDFGPRYGPRRKKDVTTGWKLVVVAGVALMFASPLVAAYRIHVAARAAGMELANAARIAKTASAAQTQLDDLVSAEAFLPERMRGPPTIEMLDAISQLTPDSTWIFRLEIRAAEATLSGFSTDVPLLLHRLGTPPFIAPELTSPVVQGRVGAPSRFDLRVQYKVGP
jgi:general secretion pathway protein L